VTLSSSVNRVIPSALRPIAKAIYHHLFRSYLRVAFPFADVFMMPLSVASVPPAILRFRVSESLSTAEFLRVGKGCADLIEKSVLEIGVDLLKVGRVLDFGCGCGRTIRWFLQAGGTAEFHGADVDEHAIEWCKRNLPGGHFSATLQDPPLPCSAEYFDVVYCISVFTHLNEAMQDVWLREIYRILKPGGVLLLTVYGKSASKHLDAEGQTRLRTHGFVYRKSDKLTGIMPDWYKTTWHSKDYIINRLSAVFGDVRYHPVPTGVQDIVVARKAIP
jgi:ubiquinone/menaquinone biosynthesis C-methylase UbiE